MKKMRLCLALASGLFCGVVIAQDPATEPEKKSETTINSAETDNGDAKATSGCKPGCTMACCTNGKAKAKATSDNGSDAKASRCKPGCAMARKSGCGASGSKIKSCCKKKAKKNNDDKS